MVPTGSLQTLPWRETDSNLWFLTGQNRNPSRPETAVRIQLSPAVSHTNLLVGIRFGSVRKQTKPRSEVEVAKGSRSLLLCEARISVFHVPDGAAKESAQAWLIRGGLVDLGVSNVTKFTEFEMIASGWHEIGCEGILS